MSGVNVVLNCSIEIPKIDQHLESEVVDDITQELKIISQQLSERIARNITRKRRLKIFKSVGA